MEYGFAAVCVPPGFVPLARRSGVRVATVIGFPFGYSAVAAKNAEVVQALADGAGELDVVIKLTALKDGDWEYLSREMQIDRCWGIAAGVQQNINIINYV